MRLLALFATMMMTLSAACSGSQMPPPPCGQAGEWLAPTAAAAQFIQPGPLLERLARQPVVLLGEAHDSAEDHRWQLHTLTQLHAFQPRLAIGFEMFPRRVQPVLDQWVAGALSEDEFLKRSEWEKVWSFDPRDYLPLFHFARMNRLPMLALNVERSLVEAVGKQGWDAVPDAEKEGVARPAPPSPAYHKELRTVFDHHPAKEREKAEAAFARFVEAQTLWDGAMAQVMARYLEKNPGVLVVGIMGAGHVRNGHGVAHQLKHLGVLPVGALLSWDRAESCESLGEDFADALYLVAQPKGNPPRLGVSTDQVGDSLRIVSVMAGSVAEQAGLKSGDVIVAVAGQPVKGLQTLRAAVQRQTPGTWLPLKIRRENSELEIVARFPSAS
ncbi:MAG: ChaN family lipoprotein [Rhodocyclaceae bacterium]|nr:ChaN family lipoprotein [Rhodocyclaceae bacterium]